MGWFSYDFDEGYVLIVSLIVLSARNSRASLFFSIFFLEMFRMQEILLPKIDSTKLVHPSTAVCVAAHIAS
jgi:hypothetical protein